MIPKRRCAPSSVAVSTVSEPRNRLSLAARAANRSDTGLWCGPGCCIAGVPAEWVVERRSPACVGDPSPAAIQNHILREMICLIRSYISRGERGCRLLCPVAAADANPAPPPFPSRDQDPLRRRPRRDNPADAVARWRQRATSVNSKRKAGSRCHPAPHRKPHGATPAARAGVLARAPAVRTGTASQPTRRPPCRPATQRSLGRHPSRALGTSCRLRCAAPALPLPPRRRLQAWPGRR